MKRNKVLATFTAAVVALGSLLGAPVTTSAADYVANKQRVSVHDPSIIKDPQSGTYYVFGSHIEAAKSTDLQSWRSFTNGYTPTNNKLFGSLSSNLAHAFAWAGENLEDCEGGFSVWAPDVIWNPDYINTDGSSGAYMMYFCTSSTYIRSVIGFAVSQNIEGPYTYVDSLIYSGFTSNDSYATSSTKNVNRKYTSTNIDELIAAGDVTYNESWFRNSAFNNQLFPNAIDPTIYYDTQGKMYMCYGSWSGGIFTLEIDPTTGRCIHPQTGTTRDGRMVDSYFGTKISGGYGKSGEGPFVEYNVDTGYYYLWVTYGGLTSEGGYNMRVFRSKNPMGPFLDAAGRNAVLDASTNLNSIGLKVMTNYKFSSLSTAYMACGHNSVLRDDDGQWYLFHHARFDDGYEFHEVRVHAMTFNEAGWPIVMPYEYSGETWSEAGYEPADLTGAYEFLNHGTATDGKITSASNITLNADGTISGAVTGTWSEAENSAAASFQIGNVTYRGKFVVQYDESKSGRRVMTFTAVGSDNQTIWGVQNAQWNGTERTLLRDFTNEGSQLVYASDTISEHTGAVRIGATKLLSGVPYYIENVNSGLVLDLPAGAARQGNALQQWAKTGGSHQEWRICDLGDGYCKIVSMADERMCIAVAEITVADGADIVLQQYDGLPNQQWKIIQSEGYYGIVSRCSEDTAGLDVYEWSTANGGSIKQWNHWGGACQLWRITPVCPAVPSGAYMLRNLNSGLWVNGDANGMQQGETPQVWTIASAGDGCVTFKDANGLAVTVADASNGAALTLTAETGALNQQFRLHCNADGSYAILSALTDAASGFDVYEVSTEVGAQICQWNFWGGDGQKFMLAPTAEIEIPPITTTTTTNDVPIVSLWGDVDCDGERTIADAILLCRYISEDVTVQISLQGVQNAECDGKEGINAEDVTTLLRALANLI